MKKNVFTGAIIIIVFVALNILFSPSSPITSSTLVTASEEIDSVKNQTALDKIPSKEIYEDMPSFNLSSSETMKASLTTEATEKFDEELYSELANLLGDNINKIGLVYYNLTTKEYVTINENMDFDAASTYKVGLNLLYYYYADKGEVDLSSLLTYYDYFYQDGTGILYGYCYSGMKISIQELLDLSIIYSDNIATAMLSDYLGGYNSVREQLYSLLNIDYVLYENLLTPAISAQILKYVYDNREISGFNHLIDTMKITTFHERLDKYIPNNLVAHKIGSIDSYVHDIGFVFTDEPYIISIYTEGVYNAEETIASMSKVIYNKHTESITQFSINKTIYDKY